MPYSVRVRKKFGWASAATAIYGDCFFGDTLFGNPYASPAIPHFGVYQQRKCKEGKLTIKMRFYSPSNPQTVPQQANRSKFADAISAWQALTIEQKLVYNNRVKNKNYSGYNLFIREYLLSH